MQARAGKSQATSRIQRCEERLTELEAKAEELSRRYGPVFKEALASLKSKLGSVWLQVPSLSEVGAMRAQILWRQLSPALEALEDGLLDLDRLLDAIRQLPPPPAEQMELAYAEIDRRERWFLRRLRHLMGEVVAEGYYRCCGCGAILRPGAGQVLGRCAVCGGICHHASNL